MFESGYWKIQHGRLRDKRTPRKWSILEAKRRNCFKEKMMINFVKLCWQVMVDKDPARAIALSKEVMMVTPRKADSMVWWRQFLWWEWVQERMGGKHRWHKQEMSKRDRWRCVQACEYGIWTRDLSYRWKEEKRVSWVNKSQTVVESIDCLKNC